MRLFMAAMLASAGLGSPAQAAWLQAHRRAVHYDVRGTGPTIIFVHGWTCDETSWARQVPAFSRNYRVVTVDLPGHGKSAPPEHGDYSMERLAEAVEAVRAAGHVDRVVLVGHSMGAGVIRRYALDYPEHVAGLVAVDGPLDIRPYANRPAGSAPLTPEARRAMIDRMFVAQTPKWLRDRVVRMMLRTSEATAIGASGRMFDPVNQSAQLVSAPALTIYGGTSLFPIDPLTKEMLPNWRYAQVAGTGHFVMLEKPAAFNGLLAAFLRNRAEYRAGTETSSGRGRRRPHKPS